MTSTKTKSKNIDGNMVKFFNVTITDDPGFPWSLDSLYEDEVALVTESDKGSVAARLYRSEDASRAYVEVLYPTQSRFVFEGRLMALTPEAAMSTAPEGKTITDLLVHPRQGADSFMDDTVLLSLTPETDLDVALDAIYESLAVGDDWPRSWSVTEKDDDGDWIVVSVHESEPSISEGQALVEMAKRPGDGDKGWVPVKIRNAQGEPLEDDDGMPPWNLMDPTETGSPMHKAFGAWCDYEDGGAAWSSKYDDAPVNFFFDGYLAGIGKPYEGGTDWSNKEQEQAYWGRMDNAGVLDEAWRAWDAFRDEEAADVGKLRFTDMPRIVFSQGYLAGRSEAAKS